MFRTPEKYKTRNGEFIIPFEIFKLKVIASNDNGWEHVSVSLKNRIPNWREMLFVKDLFWGKKDCVVQYYMFKKNSKDNDPYCLHLWRPKDKELPQPPSI